MQLLQMPQQYSGIAIGDGPQAAKEDFVNELIEKIDMNNDLISSDVHTMSDVIGELVNRVDELSKGDIIEKLGDLVALGKITGIQYFSMKGMLTSPDEDSRKLAMDIIIEKSKCEL